MKLTCGALTDVGRKRAHNEDTYFSDAALGIFVVADGMGGHAAGELASKTATDNIEEFVRRYHEDPSITWPFGFDKRLNAETNAMVTGIRVGNIAIYNLQQERAELQGMGTTVACIQITDDLTVAFAHVGDSRVYRLRKGEFEQCTRDHSWVNEQLTRGLITEEEAKNHRFRNVITRALGYKTDMPIDVKIEQAQLGDTYLLCSDGLNGMITDDQMSLLLQTTPDLQECAQKLIDAANAEGGIDNITVIVVRID